MLETGSLRVSGSHLIFLFELWLPRGDGRENTVADREEKLPQPFYSKGIKGMGAPGRWQEGGNYPLNGVVRESVLSCLLWRPRQGQAWEQVDLTGRLTGSRIAL